VLLHCSQIIRKFRKSVLVTAIINTLLPDEFQSLKHIAENHVETALYRLWLHQVNVKQALGYRLVGGELDGSAGRYDDVLAHRAQVRA
jgi:hypothetical protein